MRDNSLVERIAARRKEYLAAMDAKAESAWSKQQRLMAEADVGPPKPRGSRIKPTRTNDWGLRCLRDLSWAARRNGTPLNTGRPRLP